MNSSFKTCKKKVVTGYQGWFRAPNDGGGTGWIHWSRKQNDFSPSNCNIDF